MESVEVSLYGDIYNHRRVLLTGHTGFKGSWLAYCLQRLGAKVCGYALSAPTNPSHWDLLKLDMRSEIADIRDLDALKNVVHEFQPEIVFHLAAQPLVRMSYQNPIETYASNVMGTLNVFESCRATKSVRAVVNITSDKCYENREWARGYREDDAMGGYDPYSSSKGCSELLTASYRNSFFNISEFGRTHQVLLASCRAGNVIGGGDWAMDRLIPDIMRAAASGQCVEIRNPHAIRPWQHVLEPLNGYLLVGQHLLEGNKEAATAWNFGPLEEVEIPVISVAASIQRYWNRVVYTSVTNMNAPHEAHRLKLDCSKAGKQLGWRPILNHEITIERTVQWYREFYEQGTVATESDMTAYFQQMDKHRSSC